MSVGTLFTLFVTPAVYSLLARDHREGEEVRETLAIEAADRI